MVADIGINSCGLGTRFKFSIVEPSYYLPSFVVMFAQGRINVVVNIWQRIIYKHCPKQLSRNTREMYKPGLIKLQRLKIKNAIPNAFIYISLKDGTTLKDQKHFFLTA